MTPRYLKKKGIEKWFSQHPGTWMPKKGAALEIERNIFSGHRVLQNLRTLREYWELSFQALQQGAVKAVPLQDLEGILAKATCPTSAEKISNFVVFERNMHELS